LRFVIIDNLFPCDIGAFVTIQETIVKIRSIVLISTLALGLLAGPLPVEAQKAGKVYRIGYLATTRMESREEAFRQSLRKLGYIEGRNIVIEWRFVKRDRLAELAAELVRIKVDCIVSRGTSSTRAAKQATSTIPIVMVNVGDAVGRGLVTSLARPGGNITGLTTRNPHLAGKRLQLLKEAFPQVSLVAVLWDSSRGGNADHFTRTWTAGRALGVQLQSLEVQPPYDFENAFRAALEKRADALIAMGSGLGSQRARIVDLVLKNRLPAMYSDSRYVRAGGLMSYSADRVQLFRRTATYVDKILKGAKPADLPIEQPTKFDFLINLKTAKALGLTIPPAVLLQATKVIK
jgi:putative ABC transport system substrate-binding protein